MPGNKVQFFHLLEKLKLTKRSGWIENAIHDPKSVADHMYRMGVMALMIDDRSLDVA
ncbi:hypothetical protein BC937DRAFT_95456, partial [Endogone sp. FLAS-F59071]